MKKLRRKLKLFLAFWLKDELLELVSYSNYPPTIQREEQIVISTRELQKIQSQITLSKHYDLRREIDRAKREMCEHLMEKIEINCRDLLLANYSDAKILTLTLYVAKKLEKL